MIDLHMHTTYSDGTDTVKEILKQADKINLEVISITDHNTCNAYKEMETFKVKDLFKGNIIVGCEFTTSYKDRLIEVLGYNFDYNKVNSYLEEYYSKERKEETLKILYNRLLDKIYSIGLTFDEKSVREPKNGNEFIERCIFDELIKHPENSTILNEDVFSSFSNFYRLGLTNINSKLFLNYPEFKPPLKEIINLIHNNGGIVFLAHPYQYKFHDTEEFLNNLYNEYSFDGIECFYTTFTETQTNYLISFAQRHNLLISGGSDYHGTNKINHNLGTGNNNLNIDKNILSNWEINYYNPKRLIKERRN